MQAVQLHECQSLDIDALKEALKKVLCSGQGDEVCGNDELCKHYVHYLHSVIVELPQQSLPTSVVDEGYVPREEITDKISESISYAEIDVTPL